MYNILSWIETSVHSWEVYSIPYPKLQADLHHIAIAFIFGVSSSLGKDSLIQKKLYKG